MDQAEEPSFGLWVLEGAPHSAQCHRECPCPLGQQGLPCQGSGGWLRVPCCRDFGHTVTAFRQEQELKSASKSLRVSGQSTFPQFWVTGWSQGKDSLSLLPSWDGRKKHRLSHGLGRSPWMRSRHNCGRNKWIWACPDPLSVAGDEAGT